METFNNIILETENGIGLGMKQIDLMIQFPQLESHRKHVSSISSSRWYSKTEPDDHDFLSNKPERYLRTYHRTHTTVSIYNWASLQR